MRNFLDFLLAVLNNWAGYATGGLIVASCWLFFLWKDKPMPKFLGFLLAAIFLLMAFFKAWKDQKNIVDQKSSEVSKLTTRIEELTKSDISGEIVFAVLGTQGSGSHAGIIVNLNNKGAASAIDPSSWNFLVQTSNGDQYQGNPITLLDKNLDFCLGPQNL